MKRLWCLLFGHSLIDFGYIFVCRRCLKAWKGLK